MKSWKCLKQLKQQLKPQGVGVSWSWERTFHQIWERGMSQEPSNESYWHPSIWCLQHSVGLSWSVHSGRSWEARVRLCESQVEGSRGWEVFTHVSRLHPLWAQGNNPGFWGRGLVKQGGPGDPDGARIQSRSAHRGSEVDGNYPQQGEWIQEICLVAGTSMGGVRGLWDHPGLPMGSNPETVGSERNLLGGNVGTPTFYRLLTFQIWSPCFDLRPWRADRGHCPAGWFGAEGGPFQRCKLLWVEKDRDAQREDFCWVTKNSSSTSHRAHFFHWLGLSAPLRWPANSC